MEVILLLSCALATVLTTNVRGAAIDTPLRIITLEDLPPSDQNYFAYLEHEAIRQKRSDDILSLIKSKIAQGIKSKIGHIASGSSHSSGSGKDYHHHHHHDEHHEDDSKMFDFWDLQKSILHTLLQAVKAIKGGLIAIKGQLIKGGGYIISAKGKLLSAKGEAITNMGKHIASSANLSPRPSHHGHSEHSGPEIEYGHPSGGYIGAPTGHGIEFHSPHHGHPPSFSDHKYPSGFDEYKDHLPKGAHHGILILKKIPKGHKDKHNGNDGAHTPPDTHKPDSEPEEHPVPPFTFLPDIKSMFSASSFKHHEETSDSHHETPHYHYEAPSSPHETLQHHFEPSHHETPHHHFEQSHHETPHHHYQPSHHETSHHHFELASSHEKPKFHHESSPTPHEPSPTQYEHLLSQYQPQPTNYAPKPIQPESHSNHYTSTAGSSDASHTLSSQPTVYGSPIIATENNYAEYIKNYQHIYDKVKQVPYDSLKSANANGNPIHKNLASSSSLIPGLENFPSYPVDLSSDFANRKMLARKSKSTPTYAVHEKLPESFPDSQISASELKFLLPSPTPSSSPKLPTFMILDPNILSRYMHAQSSIEDKQPSYTKSVSRQKRPQNSDFIRFLASRLGQYGPVE